jgi:hypothetical protein
MSVHKLLLVASLCLAGCASFRFYPLPVSSDEARATFAPIATAASNLGYRYYQHSDRVIVEPDDKTRIDYMFDASGNYAMCVALKEKVAPEALEAAFAAAKARGDEVWNHAMALRPAGFPARPGAAPPPQPTFQLNITH